jgi:hypothetical protein
MAAKRLGNLLNPNKNRELGSIVQRAREMGELTTVLARVAGGAEGAAIVAANVRDDGELVVLVRSSAWASRLRYAADTLLESARAQGVTADRCTIRVARPD